jgi:hypothetical protein
MHRSRLCAVLIDCKVSDVDEAARLRAAAPGRRVDRNHPSSRGNYRLQRFGVVAIQRPLFPKNANRWD